MGRRTKKAEGNNLRLLDKDLAATYSRGSYTTTTIGKTAFDGRVRDGNGSDHSFMATKSHDSDECLNMVQRFGTAIRTLKLYKRAILEMNFRKFSENYT